MMYALCFVGDENVVELQNLRYVIVLARAQLLHLPPAPLPPFIRGGIGLHPEIRFKTTDSA